MSNCKVVIFADQHVGLKTVEHVYSQFANDLVKIVLTENSSIYHDIQDICSNTDLVVIFRKKYDSTFIETLASLKPDYFILAWWPALLKKDLLSIPDIGTINFHPSYLPYNRGKHYSFWTIVEETQFGVTLHFANEDIDAGDILFQRKIEKTWADTGETLCKKAKTAMLDLFIEHYGDIRKGHYSPVQQPGTGGAVHYAKDIDAASTLDINKLYRVKDLLNLVRAKTFTSLPACTFYYNANRYSIHSHISEIDPQNRTHACLKTIDLSETMSLHSFLEFEVKDKIVEVIFWDDHSLYHAIINVEQTRPNTTIEGKTMNKTVEFENERARSIAESVDNKSLRTSAKEFMFETIKSRYSYNFSWMGRPVIQYPQDMVAMQEIIWSVKPDLVIETGIAHGGSLMMYASFMEMMGMENGHVLGIDIDIRQHNRVEIEKHPMFKRITMFEGSSLSEDIALKVHSFAKQYKNIMVILDSNHTHEHVLKELELYAPLVTTGSYCVVFDTIIEELPKGYFTDRVWDVGNNPKTAVEEYLKVHHEFEVDQFIQNKLLITVAPEGYLKKIR